MECNAMQWYVMWRTVLAYYNRMNALVFDGAEAESCRHNTRSAFPLTASRLILRRSPLAASRLISRRPPPHRLSRFGARRCGEGGGGTFRDMPRCSLSSRGPLLVVVERRSSYHHSMALGCHHRHPSAGGVVLRRQWRVRGGRVPLFAKRRDGGGVFDGALRPSGPRGAATACTRHHIALHCIALHCIALHCIALHCIALHCIALHCIAFPQAAPCFYRVHENTPSIPLSSIP